MITVKNFIYCLETKKEKEREGEPPNTIIKGLLSCITPEFIPGTFSFSIMFSVLNLEQDQECRVSICIKNPDEEEILKTDEMILSGDVKDRNKFNVPNEYFGYNVGVDLRNILLEKEGLYHTIVFLNGTEAGEYPIYVKGKKVLRDE